MQPRSTHQRPFEHPTIRDAAFLLLAQKVSRYTSTRFCAVGLPRRHYRLTARGPRRRRLNVGHVAGPRLAVNALSRSLRPTFSVRARSLTHIPTLGLAIKAYASFSKETALSLKVENLF